MNVKSRASSSANLFLVAVVVVLAMVLSYEWWGGLLSIRRPVKYQSRVPVERGEFHADETSRIAVFREALPSVVSIRIKTSEWYAGQEQELSSGSGFVWDDQGHIVTNFHVVERALVNPGLELEVHFSDQSVAEATVLGAVQEFDLAVVRVDRDVTDLVPIRLGESADLARGQSVLAIGSPFGFDQTLSTGVIGGLNRTVSTNQGTPLTGLIQTDAAINPGNSGGPLLDSDGRLIGVNTAIFSPTGAYAGLGFAVPVSSVMKSVDMVFAQASGDPRPMMGIVPLNPESGLAALLPQELLNRGLFIRSVDPQGPAARLRLQPTRIIHSANGGIRYLLGDQIVSVDGQKVVTINELKQAVQQHQPGDTVTVQLYRIDQLIQVEVTLQAATIIL